jgi:dihydroxyacetone kinase-like predicted kinase
MQSQPASATAFNTELSESSFVVFAALFKDANGDISTIIHKCLNEKDEDKEKAFALIVGISKTGLIDSENIVKMLERISPVETDKPPRLVRAYLESNPNDTECVRLMDAIHKKYPELLGEIIQAKKGWSKAEIRKQLIKYTFTEKLWHHLAKMEEELANRK